MGRDDLRVGWQSLSGDTRSLRLDTATSTFGRQPISLSIASEEHNILATHTFSRVMRLVCLVPPPWRQIAAHDETWQAARPGNPAAMQSGLATPLIGGFAPRKADHVFWRRADAIRAQRREQAR